MENFKKIFNNKRNIVIGIIVICLISIGYYFWSGRNGRFVRTGNMSISRMDHSATLLQDGRVLITGGYTNEIFPQTIDNSYLASAEIYNPATGKFTKTSDMTEKRSNHTATLLKDGRVLITGGNIFPSYYLPSAEIYNPKTSKFAKTGDMNLGRFGHSAILLNNGKVLIMGGGFSLKSPKKNPLIMSLEARKYRFYGELYDPKTGKFTFTGKSKGWYIHPSLTLLTNGRVLVMGDYKSGKMAEIYDPLKNEFVQASYTAKISYRPNSILINKDYVLILAENKSSIYPSLYDIYKERFTKLKSSMNGDYKDGTITLLNNNKVLITGVAVYNKDGYLTDDFNTLYDIKKDNFTKIRKLRESFGGNTATLLQNGDVLITGGMGKNKVDKRINDFLKEAVLYKY